MHINRAIALHPYRLRELSHISIERSHFIYIADGIVPYINIAIALHPYRLRELSHILIWRSHSTHIAYGNCLIY
ncbi:hypothetical protein H6G81_10775 [Scytonema hofmannii FACHB-248]|uniref:Uncharacterized protein n=1 Tax=Scytonema hofmannii FACHB-248 TaxID=1842502 RepID=A0ABR8GPX3_9CYAN|nr:MULTISPECIES: hypothetical protein [Nostocales]MBD2605001.1 hypothetical protein [Scytonema hofmannii FACHB-248]